MARQENKLSNDEYVSREAVLEALEAMAVPTIYSQLTNLI